MSAQIIDGRAIAAQVYSELTTRVAVLKAKGVIPRVAIIHVGTEEMTKRYVTLNYPHCHFLRARYAILLQ